MQTERRSPGRSGALCFLRDQRGATAVLFAVMLTTLAGLAGLGVDVGIWYTLKRQYQSAADIAAISGAMELQAGKGQAGGPATADIMDLAQYAAMHNIQSGPASVLTAATSPTNSSCTNPLAPPVNTLCVNNPPQWGAYAGNSGYVEAILAEAAPSIFPGIVGFGNAIVIRTRAVAGLQNVQVCMLALNGSGTDLSFGGGGNGGTNGLGMHMPNCAFISDSATCSNSQSKNSIVINGNVTITTAATNTVGCATVTGASNSINPPIGNTAAQPDPYATLLPPPASTFPWNTTGATCTTSATTGTCCVNVASGTATILPGWYGGSCTSTKTPINIGGGTVTVCPGVYFLDGEDNQNAALVIGGTKTGTIVQMGTAGSGGCPANGLDGVMFIASCNTNPATGGKANCATGGGFIIGGTGSDDPTVTLSAPCVSLAQGSSCPNMPAGLQNVPGVLLYQVASTADSKASTTLGGAGSASLSGVIYAPAPAPKSNQCGAGCINVQGNPNFGSCIEMIAGEYSIGGTPSITQPSNCNIKTDNTTVLVLAE